MRPYYQVVKCEPAVLTFDFRCQVEKEAYYPRISSAGLPNCRKAHKPRTDSQIDYMLQAEMKANLEFAMCDYLQHPI